MMKRTAIVAIVVLTVVAAGGLRAQSAAEKPAEFTITLTTKPDPPARGNVDFEVAVQDPDKKPVVGAEVSIRLAMPAMPGMGSTVVALKAAEGKAADEGKYIGQGRLSMGGRWDATISVKVGGKDVAEKILPLTAK